MRLIVLGKYSPFPPANGACPGYLLEEAGDYLLIDCGSGVVRALQQKMPFAALHTVLLSHLHGDHCSDMSVLKYAAEAGKRERCLPAHVRVFSPDEPAAEFSRLSYKNVVEAFAVADGTCVDIGAFHVEFFGVDHAMPCVAMRITAGGKSFCYSGDTGRCRGLLEAASGVDLMLCEASLLERDKSYAASGHLTAGEAGAIAREAGVRALVITHLWPYYSEEALRAECEARFLGPVNVAQEGKEYVL
ncbi:MAG TPA: MBL fold metallo-hydrolase [Firmicutes bacterium]|nr:MBL fold metallo-hydrolase [Bacillota bacterium]